MLIYGIAAITTIILFFILIQYVLAPESNTKIIASSIDRAQTQTNLGKTVNLGLLLYEEDYRLQKTDLAKDKPIISFECTNPNYCCIRKGEQDKKYECDKQVSWDYDYFSTNLTQKILTSTRCIRVDGVGVCRVYLGSLPAQAAIDKLEVLEDKAGIGELKVTLKNTGSQQLALGKNSLKLYKKANDGSWALTDYYSDSKDVPNIIPGEKSAILWSINPTNSGTYKAEFKFEGQNAGFDQNAIEFVIDKTLSCIVTDTENQTIPNSENTYFEEIHYCAGCSYSFDCANAWTKKTGGKVFYPLDKDSAYCIKETYDGNC